MKKLGNYLHTSIKNFWNVLRIIFSNDQRLSSKRIFGAIIIISVLIYVRVPILTDGVSITDNELSILNSLLIVGALLVGGDSIKEIFKHFKSNKNGE